MPENLDKKQETPKAPKKKKVASNAIIESNGKYYGNNDKDKQYPLNDFLDTKNSAYSKKNKETIKDRAKQHEDYFLVRQCKEEVFDGRNEELRSTIAIQAYNKDFWDIAMTVPSEKGEVSTLQKAHGLKMIVLHDPTK